MTHFPNWRQMFRSAAVFTTLLLTVLVWLPFGLKAQNSLPAVLWTDKIPVLNGLADEPCWATAAAIETFTSSFPDFGKTPEQNTRVRIFYTPEAIYVHAQCAGAGLRDDGTNRDEAAEADWFSVAFDTWNDKQNAFEFGVTARGVQFEKRLNSQLSNEAYEAVWQSAVARHADGWSLEMRIPFTALRYNRNARSHWGLQCTRYDRNSGALSTWNPQRPEVGDRVWQFGEWEAPQDPARLLRLSVTALTDSRASLSNNANVFQGRDMGTLDAKIGLGSAATLDVNVLPTLSIGYDPFEYLRLNDTPQPEQLPQPRPFLSEDGGLLAKSGIHWQYPALIAARLLFRDTTPGFVTDLGDGPQYFNARFSTRTKNNYGVAVANTTLGTAWRERFNPSAFRSEYGALQRGANYNYVTVEKALKNNSWVAASNANFLAGREVSTNLSALSWQLRDAANRYEVSGYARTEIRNFTEKAFWQADYRLRLARINRAWVWYVQQQGPDLARNSFALGYMPFSLQNQSHTTSAGLEKRNFALRKRWIFSSFFLNSTQYWRNQRQNNDIFQIGGGWSGLDRHFRSWSISSHLTPVYTFENVFINVSNTLQRRLSPGGSIQVSADTDRRRRFQARFSATAFSYLKNERARYSAYVTLQWVKNRHWTFSWFQNAQALTNLLRSEPVPGKYVFRQYTQRVWSEQLRAAWSLQPRLVLYGEAGLVGYGYRNARAVELTPDRQLIPSGEPVKNTEFNTDLTAGVGINWTFRDINQLRGKATYDDSWTNESPTSPFPVQAPPRTLRYEVQVICSLDSARKNYKKIR
jgi:hypothetical protein